MKDIIMIGARGLGKESICYVEETNEYRIKYILDEISQDEIFGYKIVHPDEYSGDCVDAIFAVGYPEHKKLILEKYSRFGFNWITFIHPRANISSRAEIGKGAIIAPYAVVTGNAQISDFVLLNSFSSVGHDVFVGNYCSLMPYAFIGGESSIGEESLLSTSAKVLPKISVGPRCRISASTTVTQNVPADSLAFGNPMQFQPDTFMLRKKQKQWRT